MHRKYWLIQLFFRLNNNSFSILTEKLAKYSLIQLSFSFSFFFGDEIHKVELFKNLPFAKLSTREIQFF